MNKVVGDCTIWQYLILHIILYYVCLHNISNTQQWPVTIKCGDMMWYVFPNRAIWHFFCLRYTTERKNESKTKICSNQKKILNFLHACEIVVALSVGETRARLYYIVMYDYKGGAVGRHHQPQWLENRYIKYIMYSV